MEKHSRNMMWPLAWAWLVGLVCNVAFAAAPSDWIQENVPNYQHAMTIMARVHQNGSALKVPGSKIAIFYKGEFRGVASYDNNDGLYFYNLTARCEATTESGYTFKYYDPNTDAVYDLLLPAGYDPLVYKQADYGGFSPTFDFEPFILTLVPPTVTVSATDATATEPSTNTTATDKGTFTFTRTGDTTAALTVKFAVSGTATSGTDYTSIGTSVTIAAGSKTATKTVTPKYDTLNEGNETVIVTLATDSAYTIGTPKSATVTIKDTPPVITVKASPAAGGTATGAYTATPGQNYKLTASANAGYKYKLDKV